MCALYIYDRSILHVKSFMITRRQPEVVSSYTNIVLILFRKDFLSYIIIRTKIKYILCVKIKYNIYNFFIKKIYYIILYTVRS